MTAHDTQDVVVDGDGCQSCPFLSGDDNDVWWCQHPDKRDDPVKLTKTDRKYETPAWCPLRTRPVLVRLAAKENT